MACDLTISIATYDRPALLAATLRCCVSQTNRLALDYEILVTDNHPSGNGRIAVETVRTETTVPIRYQSEPTRNMSVLRNAGIKAAHGAMLAIIDDDETCAPDWTDALVGCMRRTGADIVVGPRFATFAAGAPPPYDPHAKMYTRDLHLPQDTPIKLMRNDGKPLYGLGTGNSLFNVEKCFSDPEPFDLAFGNAGGEDTEVFMRLYREGCRFVWCNDAVVTEEVPRHRTEIPYRLIRARRESQIYVSCYLHYTPNKTRVRLEMFAKGLIQLAAGTLLAALTPDRTLRGRLLKAQGLAKLQWQQAVGYIEEPSLSTP